MAESNPTQVILTDDGLKIIKAQKTADEAVGNINDINSDNKLSPSEKIKLKQEYDKDLKIYAIDVSQLQSAGLPTTELETAMSNLTAFVTPLFKEMNKTSTVDRDTLNGVYTAFATADKNASQAFVNMVQQVADDAKKAGDDAKEVGEKAQEAGKEAKASANQAQVDATQAKADAATAQQKAQDSIDQLNAHLPDIDEALSTANLVKQNVTKLSDTTEQYHNEYKTGIQNVIKKIDDTSTEFDQLNNAIKLKANSSDVTSQINVAITGIQNTVSNKADKSQVTQLADQYQAVVGSMTGSSLVPNSGYPIDTKHWTIGGPAKSTFSITTHAFYHNAKDNVFMLRNQGAQPTLECYISSERFPVKPNTQYSLSFKGFASSNVPSIDVFFLGRRYSSTSSTGYDKAIKIIDNRKLNTSAVEYITATFNTGDCEEGYLRIDNNGSTDGKDSDLFFTEIQVNPGTIAMPWSAPTLSQADITASIGNIHLGVKNADGSTSTFNMSGNTILMDTAQTIINGKTSILDGTIGTAKIANAAINTAQIADGAINNAKIANAAIDDAKISNMNGNKITANSITANKINVDDLIANGINTKTLTSVNLNTSTLTTPNLDLGLNGTFTEDFDYTQSTSIFLPKKNTGTLTFNHGVLQSKGNMQTYVNGQWGGMNDNYTFQAGIDNSQWTEVAPGYIKLDLFKQNDIDVAERTYVDPTGFYYTTNGNQVYTSYVGNIVSTPQVQTSSVLTKYIGPSAGQNLLQIDNNGSHYGLQVGSYAGQEAVLSDYIYDFTASTASNVYITSNGHLARTTSASKYKYNISNPDYEDVLGDRLLNVHLASWNDKNAINSYAHTLNTGEDTEKISIDKYHGLIAEQLRDAGLEMFVEYNEDGEIEGIQYDRAWIPLLAVVRRLNNKINEYEMRISKLEGKK